MNSNVCIPAQISGQSYNISDVEYQFTCNYASSVTKIELTEKACKSNNQCGNSQCCAIRKSVLKTLTTTTTISSPNNYPPKRFCIDKSKVGSQFWLRYTPGTTTHNLNNDIVVDAECMKTPTFKKLDSLKFDTMQTMEKNALIDNQKNTIITNFMQTVGSYLKLYDETTKAK